MNTFLISLLIGELAVVAPFSYIILRGTIGRATWPRVCAKVTDHEVYWLNDGWLLVTFETETERNIRARISNPNDDSIFLSKHPIGSELEICYNPKNSMEACVPVSKLSLLFVIFLVGVINYGFVLGIFKSWTM
jgi:hypothetical protein